MSVQAIGWAFDQAIGDPLAKLVLIALANHSNGKSGRCNPKVETLAGECAQTPSNIKKKLAYLEQSSLIKRVSRFAPSGTQLANGYVLLLDAEYRPFASIEPTSPDDPWEDDGVSEQVGGGYPTREGEGIQNRGVGYPTGAGRVSHGSGGRVSPGIPRGYPVGAPHIEPESEPEKKNQERESASQTLRARDDGSGDLFGAEKQAPPSAAERGLARTELVDRPTFPIAASPSPSSESKKERKKDEREAKQDSPQEGSAPPPQPNATVATPPDAAASCVEPKRRRTKDKPPAVDASFEAWWATYPKKVGKSDARRAYAAAGKKASVGELLDGVKRYVEALNAKAAQEGRDKPDPQFTKNPSGWLNGERWLDEAAPEPTMRLFDVHEGGAPRTNGRRMSKGDENIARNLENCRRMGLIR
jgi:hypothetical protein